MPLLASVLCTSGMVRLEWGLAYAMPHFAIWNYEKTPRWALSHFSAMPHADEDKPILSYSTLAVTVDDADVSVQSRAWTDWA